MVGRAGDPPPPEYERASRSQSAAPPRASASATGAVCRDGKHGNKTGTKQELIGVQLAVCSACNAHQLPINCPSIAHQSLTLTPTMRSGDATCDNTHHEGEDLVC